MGKSKNDHNGRHDRGYRDSDKWKGEERGDDVFKFNVSEDAPVNREGDETVKVSAGESSQVRLTFTSAQVGNGNPNNDAGLLAVSLQAENTAGTLIGNISRFDDEGITFETKGKVTFDVRDTSGTQRGDQFDVVELGTARADKFNETGSNEAYYFNAGMGADNITGGNRADFLVGGGGDDKTNGSLGNDTHIGGAGKDVFVFDTKLGPNNIDTILDYTAADDTIQLDKNIFKGLADGSLAPGSFASNTAGNAVDAGDRIIYDSDSGELYFDADGSGAAAKVQFATLLTNGAAAAGVTSADFVVKKGDDKNVADRGDHQNRDHKGRDDRDDKDNDKNKDDHKDAGANDLANADKKVLEQIFGKDAVKDADQFFASSFIALNDSKVSGAALLLFDEDSGKLSVAVSAHGLTPNEVHIQHIHGFTGANPANSSVPTNAQDTDRDGFVEIAEGSATYGPVLLDFDPFPTADANGNVFFVNTYQLPSQPSGIAQGLDIPPDLTLREIVVHGLDVPAGFGVGTPGEIKGTGGYIPALPVASNEIVNLNSAQGNLAITEFKNELSQNDWALT